MTDPRLILTDREAALLLNMLQDDTGDAPDAEWYEDMEPLRRDLHQWRREQRGETGDEYAFDPMTGLPMLNLSALDRLAERMEGEVVA